MSLFSTTHPSIPASAVDRNDPSKERDPIRHRHLQPHHLSRSVLLALAALLRFPSSSPSCFSPFTSSSSVGGGSGSGDDNDNGKNTPVTIFLPKPWLAAQKHTIATALPIELCRRTARTSLTRRIVGRILGTDTAAAAGDGGGGGGVVVAGCGGRPSTLLCPAHAGLDADVVGFWLGLVRAEVTVRCDVVRAGVRLLLCREGRMVDAERVGEVVVILDEVAGLVLDCDDEFGRYGSGKGVRRGWRRLGRVESGCAACVLAVVGGRREALVALRANMKAREKGREPRLVKLVEAWMEVAGWREGREMMAESEQLAGEVREVRRWMHERKVRRRGDRGEGGDGERGRRRHRRGLPSKARIDEGVPMPQVRPYDRRHHIDRQHDFRPIYGLDGAADLDPSALGGEPSGGQTTWHPSVSPNVNDEVDPNSEFVPARSFWPHTDYSTYQSNTAPEDRETVHAFLDQSRRQTGGGHAPTTQHSTATDWGDIYRGGQGWL